MTAALDLEVADPRLTEQIVAELLRARHTGRGNGGAGTHAFLTQVRNAAGFDADRIFDAMAVDLWPSRGFVIHIFEIKTSRSDWRRELVGYTAPSGKVHGGAGKGEAACAIGDKFSIVAPAGCVHDGELPPTWGLLEITGTGTEAKPWKLRQKKEAPLLHDENTARKPLPRGLMVSMLRAAPGAVPGGKNPSASDAQMAVARAEGQTKGFEQGRQEGVREARMDRRGDETLAEQARVLMKALEDAGGDHNETRIYRLQRAAPAILEALRGQHSADRLLDVRRTLTRALDDLGGPIDTTTTRSSTSP